MSVPHSLIELAHDLAEPSLDASILAEGNVACAAGDERLWVKASGHRMGGIAASGFTEVWRAPVLRALDEPPPHEDAVRDVLNGARCAPDRDPAPSTETYMAALLLQLPGIEFVAHTHPTALIALLSTKEGQNYARMRLFPDHVVFCGPASCWVPYVPPGLPLALEMRKSLQDFQRDWSQPPKAIWLQNHGLITVGASAKEAACATFLSIKAARALLGALQTGAPLAPMTRAQVEQIANWKDEHFRQQLLWGESDSLK
jgi:L-ribulose-5-phosphate 4-epimerase